MSTKIPAMDLPKEDPGNEIMFGNHTAGWYKWAAWFAQQVVSSRAMSHLETAERAFTILCKGDELGLKPFAAWTWIYTTKAGRLAIMSKGALAVVQGTPAFDGYEERIEGEGKTMRAVALAKRKNFPPTIKEFTYADAEVAGLLKPGRTRDGGSYDTTYQAYLKDMLLSRARGRVLDIAFAAELGGIVVEGIAEDADEMDARRNAKREPKNPAALPPRRDPLLASLAPKVETPQLVSGKAQELPSAAELPELDPAFVKIIEEQVTEMFGPPDNAPPLRATGGAYEATAGSVDPRAAEQVALSSGPPPAVKAKPSPPSAGVGSRQKGQGKAGGAVPVPPGAAGEAWGHKCSRCERTLNPMGGCDVCGWPGPDLR